MSDQWVRDEECPFQYNYVLNPRISLLHTMQGDWLLEVDLAVIHVWRQSLSPRPLSNPPFEEAIAFLPAIAASRL